MSGMKEFSCIGKSIERVDAPSKVTGEARFFGDVKLPAMLIGRILTSPYAHAKIISIDTSKAERLPGVRAVVTSKDMPEIPLDFHQVHATKHTANVALASDRVRFIGEEVAAVAADSEDIAEQSLKLIRVKYEVLNAVFDPEEAMKPGAPILYDETANNIGLCITREYGDVEKGFAEADYIFEDEFKTQPQHHAALETQGCVCSWGSKENLTIWTGSQTPHLFQWMLGEVLSIPIAKTRVISPYVGGGFGSLGHVVFPYHVICAVLAKKTGKPVKIEFSRDEQFLNANASAPFVIRLKTGVKKDGKLTARQIRIIEDSGAHPYSAPGQLGVSTNTTFAHLHKVPNIMYEGYVVYTNNPITPSAYRGFGNPQVTFAIESQMDIIAEKLGMDPKELQLKNLFEQGETSMLGWKFSSYGLPECIKKAAEALDWSRRREERVPNRGIGMACGIHVTGWRGVHGSIETSSVVMIAKEDGSFNLYTDFSELGTGVWTVAQAVAAEVLGACLEDIQVVAADTAFTPFDLGSYASRGTYSLGNAVKLAATDMRNQLFEVAATMLKAGIENLEAKDGAIYLRETPEKKVSIAEVTDYAHFELGKVPMSKGIWNMPASLFDRTTGRWPSPGPMTSYPFACQVVEVEVDTETGKVKVLSVASAHDLGFPINLAGVEGQIEGGVVMGLGYALTENLRSEEGRVLVGNFSDYFIRGALDLPEIKSIVVTSNDPYGPFGAKGVGETVMIPTSAAIANAVYNAVGVRIKELPLTPDKILKALKEKGKS
ncbi:xanthine dehydrogenase family protein molybdopterin-binding subunit [Chloroflexota bacterium]